MSRGDHQLSMSFNSAQLASSSEDDWMCQVFPVGRRRDGGTRYWCKTHCSDATAKYGRPLLQCKGASSFKPDASDPAVLDLDAFQGGVAIWGAVPPVYDTTCKAMERGIHVHARELAGGPKTVDDSFAVLSVLSRRLPPEGVRIAEIDAIYFMVSSVLGMETRAVNCTFCGHPHLDKDLFSVHPHRKHLCANCGRHFFDRSAGIGNPIGAVRAALGVVTKPQVKPSRPLKISQAEFPGGIQIWGTNAAILWTGDQPEEEGIHVHAFRELGGKRSLDETYSEVTIDGLTLDPVMIRTLMAQRAIPSLAKRVQVLRCDSCESEQFDSGILAVTARSERKCNSCNEVLATRGRYRNVVANPIVGKLENLARLAPRKPQRHDLGFAPETLDLVPKMMPKASARRPLDGRVAS